MARSREQAIEQLLAPGWEDLHPYKKWQGAHWRVISLVELGVRSHPQALAMLDRTLAWLTNAQRAQRAPVVEGRVRHCASQEGNGLLAASRLGEGRAASVLAERLVAWQWPDGGWNCDSRSAAAHSSFHETVWPLRGLVAYDAAVGDTAAREAARRAAEFLLGHRLFRSERTGEVIDREWLHLHWPPTWRYDVLQGLRAIAEAGHAQRPEATEAFTWLEGERRDDGTWGPSGRRYWSPPGSGDRAAEVVDWGSCADDILTEQALDVLAQRG